MNKSRFILSIALISLMLFSGSLFADYNHAAPFLRMGVGARALGMGKAFTAVSNDAFAGYWNPAGLTTLEKNIEIGFTYSANMSVDRQYNNFGLGWKFGNMGVGLTWINAGMSDIQAYNENNVKRETFNYSSNSILLSYGVAPIENVGVGASIKLLTQKLDESTPMGYGADIGVKYSPQEMVSIGFVAQDVGCSISKETIPITYRIGLAARPVEGLTASADIVATQGNDKTYLNMGAEYWGGSQSAKFGVRGALSDGTFAGGVGFRVSVLEINYTYMSEKQSEFMKGYHPISLSIRF